MEMYTLFSAFRPSQHPGSLIGFARLRKWLISDFRLRTSLARRRLRAKAARFYVTKHEAPSPIAHRLQSFVFSL